MRASTTFFNCALSLLLGLAIYLYIRDEPVIFLKFLHLNDTNSVDIINLKSKLILPNVLKTISNHGGDFLWIYGLSIGHFYFFENSLSNLVIFFKIGIIPLVIAFTFEIMQFYELIGGTFDTNDLTVYVLGFSIGIIVYKICNRSIKNDTE
jgi:hypothetical protein